MTGAVVVGASGGIGRALVEALVVRGEHAPVFAASRSQARFSEPVRPIGIDLTDEASVAEAARIVAEAGPVGLVVVASGILHEDRIAPEKTFRSLDSEAMARLFSVNATGPALVAKHFLPLLPKSGRCVFAALSARVGSIEDNRLGGWYAYRASKAALNQILRCLAIEVARTRPEAIVAGLHPGTVATALSRPFRDASAPGLFTPDESAAHLLRVLDGLGPGDSGGVFAWDGQRIPP